MTRVLWLTPNKPENISVGRRRIATHLEADGFEVTLQAGRPKKLVELVTDNVVYDVVVGTTRAGAIAGAGLTAITGWPLVVDHVDPIRQFEETNPWPLARIVRHLEHVAFRRSAHTLYIYPEERARVERYAPAVTETDLGVEFDRFADPEEGVLASARNRLSEFELCDNVAIYVGGLEPIYHVQELVASVDHLPEWSLLILGSGSLEGTIADAADDSDAVVFPGAVPHEEVPGYLHRADVGVSLVDDPHTLKVLEYGAARLPTVQLSGRAERKLAGSVEFCDADPESIAAAIERATTADSATLDALQDLAREYSWERIADQYAGILRTVGDT